MVCTTYGQQDAIGHGQFDLGHVPNKRYETAFPSNFDSDFTRLRHLSQFRQMG